MESRVSNSIGRYRHTDLLPSDLNLSTDKLRFQVPEVTLDPTSDGTTSDTLGIQGYRTLHKDEFIKVIEWSGSVLCRVVTHSGVTTLSYPTSSGPWTSVEARFFSSRKPQSKSEWGPVRNLSREVVRPCRLEFHLLYLSKIKPATSRYFTYRLGQVSK